MPGKHVICTDSLSSISSITNHNNHSHCATSVRNLVTKHFPKISLVWVPSHIGLVGNENADEAAKLASKFQFTLTANNNSNDITHFLKKEQQDKQTNILSSTSNWYQQIATFSTSYSPHKHSPLSRRQQIIINRLRLGHTFLTNAHYLYTSKNNLCPLCNNARINIQHIICSCPTLSSQCCQSFHNLDPILSIANPTIDNFNIIYII